MPEQQIIQEILEGNNSKFKLLVEKYQNMVFRTTIGFVHNKEDAEDLTQDVFIRAFQSLKTFNGDAEFSTWLYRITVNTSINHLNKTKNRGLLHFAEVIFQNIFNRASEDKNPQQQMEQTERDKTIRKAIDALPEKQRTAFVLSKYDDLTQKEIAVIMQSTEGSVEQLLQRAKSSLKKKLSPVVGKQ
jgi:RNA polymerase sigma-70 factor (ECF subfamily)